MWGLRPAGLSLSGCVLRLDPKSNCRGWLVVSPRLYVLNDDYRSMSDVFEHYPLSCRIADRLSNCPKLALLYQVTVFTHAGQLPHLSGLFGC